MATLKDVAQKACVDVSTVSRALNNTSYVHPDTKARIYAAAKELGYHPNVVAKALRQGKSHTIGVVCPRLHLSIFSEVLQGIETQARALNYGTIISIFEDDPKAEKECLKRMRNGLVDGIIISASGKNNRLLQDIAASGIPLIQMIRRQDYKISSIEADYEGSGYQSVKYLYQKGRRHIGFVVGNLNLNPYCGRYDGYQKAIREFGLEEILAESTVPGNGFDHGYDCAQILMDNYSELDAIVTAKDTQGLGAMRAVRDRGLRIPEDIAVMSLTGHQLGNMLETRMTSLEMPAREMGEKASQMLISDIEAISETKKPTPFHLTFPFTLVEREST